MSHETDAKFNDKHSRPNHGQTKPQFGIMLTGVDSLTYNMQHPNRGKCLIFNHQTFDRSTSLKPRNGTERDARALSECMKRLDFDIKQHDDLSVKDLMSTLKNVSKENHIDNDCLVIAVLSHGERDVLWARDNKYLIDMIFSHFTGSQCPTLAGKPKIFIIQACRGEAFDSGTTVMSMSRDVPDGNDGIRIPNQADFLVAYSTPPGYYSFRNQTTGSFFVQELARVITDFQGQYKVDLMTLLTITNRNVAYEFESQADNSEHNKKKQIPCVVSMLTRLVYFPPKKSSKNLIDIDL